MRALKDETCCVREKEATVIKLNGGRGLNGSKYNQTYNGDITINGDIDGDSRVSLVSTTGIIVVRGRIDGSSKVTLVSNMGSILVSDRIDGSSDVTLIAPNGKVAIGPEVDFSLYNDNIGKIDGSSQVYARVGEYIFIHGRIDGSSNVVFKAQRGINIKGRIDGGAIARLQTDFGFIHIQDKIDHRTTYVAYSPENSLKVDKGHRNGELVYVPL